MSTTRITVEQVTQVEHHPQADRLDVIQVLGYKVVTGRDQFKVGDSAIYFPPDILINTADELGVKKYLKHAIYPGETEKTQCRVSSARLRGVPSHGFVVQTQDPVGIDLTEKFGGQKYVPPVRVCAGDALPDLPTFHKYTEIENIQRYPNAIPVGELCRFSEKLHGCVVSKQSITMADGTKKPISKIEAGDELLGIEDGQVCTSVVTKVFRNGSAEKWLNIKTTRINVDRGISFASVRCTPEHKFWSPTANEFVVASQLKVGDKVLMFRSNLEMSPVAKQVLLGKMLGDGSLSVNNRSGKVSWGHVIKELTEWTGRGVGRLYKPQKSQTSGYGSTIHRANTTMCYHVKAYLGDFYAPGGKRLPKWVTEEITPLAIAFWYMDDGSLSHNDGQEDRAVFNSCNFTDLEHDLLLECLLKFGIKGVKYQHEGFWRIRVNSDDAEKLFLLIAPYITPALQYKLPERYRGHTGWLPNLDSEYKPDLVEQTVTEITDITNKTQSQRFDLETTTHNYFAGDILVHNSNCRVGLVKDDGEFIFAAGSHQIRRAEYSGEKRSLYWEPMDESMMNLLTYLCDEKHSVVVFGEIFGSGIQDLDYGQTKPAFRVFDISVDGVYLSLIEINQVCNFYEIQIVPILYIGKFDPDLVEYLTYGDTVACAQDQIKSRFKGREGVVVTPFREQFSEILGGRMIVKSVSADYRDRKGAQDNE